MTSVARLTSGLPSQIKLLRPPKFFGWLLAALILQIHLSNCLALVGKTLEHPKEAMQYQVELSHSDLTHTAVIRSRVKPRELAQFVPAACGEVWSFIRSARLPRPGRHVALSLDDKGSVEVGAEVSEPFVGNDRVLCSQLPTGRVATTIHLGPYALLSNAHAAIREWCAGHGHQLLNISWEIYGHWQENWNTNPSNIRTDVYYLLQDQNG
jgi:effector-binding domain-containing protein